TRDLAERERQTFLLDQQTRLHGSPCAPAIAGRKAPFAKWKIVERNSRPLDFDLFFVATKMSNHDSQGFRADKNELYCLQHLPCSVSKGRLVHIHQHIGAMK